jgi:hypothetical protein
MFLHESFILVPTKHCMARKRIKSVACGNCGYSFKSENNFCPNCGQENHTHKLPIKHFLYEFAETLTHFDTKFLTTSKEMIIKPGLVAKNYNDNKRARYVPPVRMYVFMSFIFFLMVSLLASEKAKIGAAAVDTEMRYQNSQLDSNFNLSVNFLTKTTLNQQQLTALFALSSVSSIRVDSFLQANSIPTSWANTKLLTSIVRMQKGELSTYDIYQKFIKYLSYAIFFFMPYFAFLLKLFYRKKSRYYTEHLVFSVYFHTFILALLLLFFLYGRFISNTADLGIVAVLAITLYMGFSLKRLYEEGIGKTVLKTILLSLIYWISLLLMVLGLFLGSIF